MEMSPALHHQPSGWQMTALPVEPQSSHHGGIPPCWSAAGCLWSTLRLLMSTIPSVCWWYEPSVMRSPHSLISGNLLLKTRQAFLRCCFIQDGGCDVPQWETLDQYPECYKHFQTFCSSSSHCTVFTILSD